MIPSLCELLQRMKLQDKDATNDTPILKVNEAQKAMDRAAKEIGMERITHHDLRHLFATRMLL